MIDGLKLTFSGDELRSLLEARIRKHEEETDRWTREQKRGPEDQTEDAPLLPEHMCEHEAERHAWRCRVLAFIRDHVVIGETYRLDSADLDFGELLPAMPGSVEQEEFEERTGVRFGLERMTKAIDGLTGMAYGMLSRQDEPQRPGANPAAGIIEETNEFITRRIDLGDGPEVISIQRK